MIRSVEISQRVHRTCHVLPARISITGSFRVSVPINYLGKITTEFNDMIRRRAKYRLTTLQREKMRAACRFNAQLMDFIRPHIKEGNTTESIDRMVHDYTLDHGHTPACLGYPGDKYPFPKSCCMSVNEVICHGIPGSYPLKSGDIVNLDLTTIVDGASTMLERGSLV